MQEIKGVKLPRRNKQHVLDYEIFLPPLLEQQKFVSEIEKNKGSDTGYTKETRAIIKAKRIDTEKICDMLNHIW